MRSRTTIDATAGGRRAADTSTSHLGTALDWRAAFVLGLITSTWSTVVLSLGAAQIGRSIGIDWMVVGAIVLRGGGLVADPGWREIAAGILVHQTFDVLWTVLFFTLLGGWTRRLSPFLILLAALPWAVVTSGIEYFLWLPWAQPVFVMQQPYWAGLVTHATSASLYPLFPWLRDRMAGRRVAYPFVRVWLGLAALGLAALAVLAVQASRDWAPRHVAVLPGDAEVDRRFLRMMTFHHRIGVRLAEWAAQKADAEGLRQLANLMIADQSGEIRMMGWWWRNWFGRDMPPLTSDEEVTMPGMPTDFELETLGKASGPAFDDLFVAVMVHHHAGALAMAEEAEAGAVDPRVRIIADGLHHAQRNQIAMMHRIVEGYGLQSPLLPGQTPAMVDPLPTD